MVCMPSAIARGEGDGVTAGGAAGSARCPCHAALRQSGGEEDAGGRAGQGGLLPGADPHA